MPLRRITGRSVGKVLPRNQYAATPGPKCPGEATGRGARRNERLALDGSPQLRATDAMRPANKVIASARLKHAPIQLWCTLVVGALSACSATKEGNGTSTGAGASPTGAGGAGGSLGGAPPAAGGGLLSSGGGHMGGGNANASCTVDGEQDALQPCLEVAPPNSFDPVTQWAWTAPVPLYGSVAIPLVGNFTDDNADGAVNLCDTPDVIVSVAEDQDFLVGKLYMLAGDTGAQELVFQTDIATALTPAFGDVDGDGVPEVIAVSHDQRITAFANDGTVKWQGDQIASVANWDRRYCGAISLYDLNGDGEVEILLNFEVFNSIGQKAWGFNLNKAGGSQFWCTTTTAADLDGDGKLEVLFGNSAYTFDGTQLWQLASVEPGHPHVGNFDADPEPEIFITTRDGYTLVNADGSVIFSEIRPTDEAASENCWGKPGAVHDFDGDGKADVAAGTCSKYSAYTVAESPVAKWVNDVTDVSGLATGTGFDFLGDGIADAIYADEKKMYAYDGKTGALEFSANRTSSTLIEYPVVADIDNDGSAEILVVSNYRNSTGGGETIRAIRDAQDRWIPARRIWNQHAYHVTNVREDGVIPAHMQNNWQRLNTFRTNAQVEEGGDCVPAIPK